DAEAASSVFNAGWPRITMVASDIGERTLLTRRQLEQLQAAHGPQSDFVALIAKYLLDLSDRFGFPGAAMYDPVAVGVVVVPSIATTKNMHVDVETRGEFRRSDNLAISHNNDEAKVLH